MNFSSICSSASSYLGTSQIATGVNQIAKGDVKKGSQSVAIGTLKLAGISACVASSVWAYRNQETVQSAYSSAVKTLTETYEGATKKVSDGYAIASRDFSQAYNAVTNKASALWESATHLFTSVQQEDTCPAETAPFEEAVTL